MALLAGTQDSLGWTEVMLPAVDMNDRLGAARLKSSSWHLLGAQALASLMSWQPDYGTEQPTGSKSGWAEVHSS